MKYLVSALLFVFVTFLATPTLVMLIEKKADVSVFYSFAEEEHQKENKEVKEIKSDLSFKNQFEFVLLNPNTSTKIISENLSKHDCISEEIFSPPPELV